MDTVSVEVKLSGEEHVVLVYRRVEMRDDASIRVGSLAVFLNNINITENPSLLNRIYQVIDRSDRQDRILIIALFRFFGLVPEEGLKETADRDLSAIDEKLVKLYAVVMGVSCARNSNFGDACSFFLQATPLPDVLFNLGVIYKARGEIESAITYFEQVSHLWMEALNCIEELGASNVETIVAIKFEKNAFLKGVIGLLSDVHALQELTPSDCLIIYDGLYCLYQELDRPDLLASAELFKGIGCLGEERIDEAENCFYKAFTQNIVAVYYFFGELVLCHPLPDSSSLNERLGTAWYNYHQAESAGYKGSLARFFDHFRRLKPQLPSSICRMFPVLDGKADLNRSCIRRVKSLLNSKEQCEKLSPDECLYGNYYAKAMGLIYLEYSKFWSAASLCFLGCSLLQKGLEEEAYDYFERAQKQCPGIASSFIDKAEKSENSSDILLGKWLTYFKTNAKNIEGAEENIDACAQIAKEIASDPDLDYGGDGEAIAKLNEAVKKIGLATTDFEGMAYLFLGILLMREDSKEEIELVNAKKAFRLATSFGIAAGSYFEAEVHLLELKLGAFSIQDLLDLWHLYCKALNSGFEPAYSRFYQVYRENVRIAMKSPRDRKRDQLAKK